MQLRVRFDRDVDLQPVALQHATTWTGDGEEGHPGQRRVEKMTDALDRQLMSGALPQKEYDIAMRELAQWADRQYGWNPKG